MTEKARVIMSSSCKMVKNATLTHEGDIFKCYHYETNIFEYDSVLGTCKVKRDLSMTSNRQIAYLLAFFNIEDDKVTDLNENEKLHDKWSFSESI